MKRLPEMLLRWNVVESLLAGAIREAAQTGDWESGVREMDQLIAATTLRGSVLDDTSDEIANPAWESYEQEAVRKYPNDPRVQNDYQYR